jgi:Zn-dependent peptidase ImmA (M78 family)
MDKLNDIFKIIDNENIILEETNLNHTYLKGIYFSIPEVPPTIGIDKSIVSYSFMYISVLAEELGHHFTTSGNLLNDCNNYSEELQKNKKEQNAKLWAANLLISDEEFVHALNSCISSISSMAEYFNVTEEIINYKILSITLDELKYINIRNNFKIHEVPYNSCAI